MLDGLLKSKFQTKCKSLIKMTKTRLDGLKKKKFSVLKFLKNDVADLLRSGLDDNAYGRAEGLLVEQKMVVCYDFLEKFCECVSTNLATMDKQGECPEECKEAVESLIYAAARVSEFPELRDLRNIFTRRYGSSLEPYINKKFVETFEPLSATKEMKLQLLHDIAAEFNIEWNSRSLAIKVRRSDPAQDEEQPRHEPFNKSDHKKGELMSRRRKNGTKSSSEDDTLSYHRRDSSDLASSSSVGSGSEDEMDVKKPLSFRSVPPPYDKATAESKNEEPHKKETNHKDDLTDNVKQKPRSVRRNKSGIKSPPGQENVGSFERPLKPPPGHKNFGAKIVKEEEKQADDDEDEEEKMLDDLLIRYSKAKPPWKPSKDANEALSVRKTKSELPAPPGRALSEEGKAKKLHARTVSDQSQAMSRHVHPNLPDFDDLQARIAALQGR